MVGGLGAVCKCANVRWLKTSFFLCVGKNKNTKVSVVVSEMSVGVLSGFGRSVDVCTVVG